MPPRRLAEPARTIALAVDGERVPAIPGEPIAVALTAAGRLVLGRSVKYHRPRGAACYAGRCDGCLMRVDGVSSVRTCRTPARDGMRIETQNVLGSAERDLLSATDWFFPDGMDHHHMFTRFSAVNRIMQKVARRIAGIGRIPDAVIAPAAPHELAPDVLVVGAGPAGLAAAEALARAGASVLVADEEPEPGGHLRHLPGAVPSDDGTTHDARDLARTLATRARDAGARILTEHAVVGVYPRSKESTRERSTGPSLADRPLLVAIDAPDRLVVARPRALLVATGAHEGTLAVEGNDIPGVIGARAAARLLAAGVLPGIAPLVAGDGRFAAAVATALSAAGAKVHGPVPATRVRRIVGRPAVRSVVIDDADGKERRVKADAVVLAAPASAAYEVGAQAGAEVAFRGDAFVLVAGAGGRTCVPAVHAAGECTGAVDPAAAIASGRAAARALLDTLGEPHV